MTPRTQQACASRRKTAARWPPRLGYGVAQVFSDNDRGASTRSRKPRPTYTDMLRRAKAREFAALLVYSTSRLTRRPLVNEDLIALVEQHGCRSRRWCRVTTGWTPSMAVRWPAPWPRAMPPAPSSWPAAPSQSRRCGALPPT